MLGINALINTQQITQSHNQHPAGLSAQHQLSGVSNFSVRFLGLRLRRKLQQEKSLTMVHIPGRVHSTSASLKKSFIAHTSRRLEVDGATQTLDSRWS